MLPMYHVWEVNMSSWPKILGHRETWKGGLSQDYRSREAVMHSMGHLWLERQYLSVLKSLVYIVNDQKTLILNWKVHPNPQWLINCKLFQIQFCKCHIMPTQGIPNRPWLDWLVLDSEKIYLEVATPGITMKQDDTLTRPYCKYV